MRASRGMGAIKKQGKKTIIQRKDDPNSVVKYAKGGKLNIAKAIKKPGALHAQLGVPQGQKIPAKKLAKAAKADGKLGQRARFAQTLKGLNK